MTVSYTEHPDARTVELTVDGAITQAEFDNIMTRMEAFIAKYDKVRILEVIHNFKLTNITPSMIWGGIKFDTKNLRHFTRAAIVSDIGWISPWTKFIGSLITTKTRIFPLKDIEDARKWVMAKDNTSP